MRWNVERRCFLRVSGRGEDQGGRRGGVRPPTASFARAIRWNLSCHVDVPSPKFL